MSGGGLLPVGGFATTAALRSGLTLVGGHNIVIAGSAALTTTPVWYTGSSATATVGIYAPYALHVTRVSCSGHCSANSGTPTPSVTLWHTNQTAGSEIITAAAGSAVASGTGYDWTNVTIVNSGKDAVAAGVKMLVSAVCTATSCTLAGFNIRIEWTVD